MTYHLMTFSVVFCVFVVVVGRISLGPKGEIWTSRRMEEQESGYMIQNLIQWHIQDGSHSWCGCSVGCAMAERSNSMRKGTRSSPSTTTSTISSSNRKSFLSKNKSHFEEIQHLCCSAASTVSTCGEVTATCCRTTVGCACACTCGGSGIRCCCGWYIAGAVLVLIGYPATCCMYVRNGISISLLVVHWFPKHKSYLSINCTVRLKAVYRLLLRS